MSDNNNIEASIPVDSSKLVPNSSIKIATFNLFNYLEPPFAFYDFEKILSSEQWQKKQNWIIDYLVEFKPDVIGFQEVFSPEPLKQLVQEQGYPYFHVVDQAEVVDDFICKSPVVAIASKYEITEISAVQPNKELAQVMGLNAEFSFSRKVLRATIDLPHIGPCDCYVVHFKSKRPLIEHEQCSEMLAEKNIIEKLKAQVIGGWGSSIQRGSEAALLFVEMISQREQSTRPIMLLGDFNNTLQDGVLTHLITDKLRFASAFDVNAYLEKYCLNDAWDLFQNTDNDTQHISRKPTHYYGATGSVLDYILLSCEFDANYQGSLFEVSGYDTYDRHLINPIFERDGESTDHGVVLVTLSLRV
ncbi:endonuclease/exonuclease/phosphatase family protein [Thalassotalea psychrophila]|uniref:Endonuclease/exonuclease/phosphatase family protein n=1 Tax=Thalassotalea psychrophila TaxID=3065647 RepID=A0ABY9TZ60_9GAMM|nr:endonuclease/exonuclease/phosphatase family protein [Colwelliaceae bacterium SQ149]